MSTDLPAGLDFHVKRAKWSDTRWVEQPVPGDPAPGQVLFHVDRFAFTANNISYAMAGDMLRYWDFFPTEDGWGRIPTMGYADVVASTHPDVAEGTRCFGFYPMSRYLVIEPNQANAAQIVDGVSNREGLAPAYNTYNPVAHDPGYSAVHEDQAMLMRGLFMTSFLADDMIGDSDYYGATQVVVGSASSKTAIALAYLLHTAGRAKVIGVTSPRNSAFVTGLGTYDEVVHYDDIESVSQSPTVLVDMSGDGDMVNQLHRHLGANMKYSCIIGATHWDAGPRADDLPGAKPEFFFAPGQIQKRSKEWGPQVLMQRLGESWSGFRDGSDAWLKVVRESGREAVERVYQETLAGKTLPNEGHVLSLRA